MITHLPNYSFTVNQASGRNFKLQQMLGAGC